MGVSLLLLTSYAQKTWYFSSSTGNDNNPGLSPSAPLKSLQKLQELLWGAFHQGNRLMRGDTIAFMRGDTFRVPYIGANNQPVWVVYIATPLLTQPGAPVVFTAYGPANAKPVFTATWNLAQLQGTVVSTSPIIKIYKPLRPWDTLTVFRVFYRGKPLVLAREPDISEPWDVVSSMWPIDSAYDARSYDTLIVNGQPVIRINPDTIFSASIASLSSSWFEGATLWGSTAGYSWQWVKPVGPKQGNMLILPTHSGWAKFFQGNRFYVENKLELLDAPGEWYYADDTLYIYPPSGQTNFQLSDYEILPIRPLGMRGPLRPIPFGGSLRYDTMPDLPLQNVIIQDLAFSGFPADGAIHLAGARDIQIKDCYFYECSPGMRFFVVENVSIRNNVFRNIELNAIGIFGGGTPDYVPPGYPKTLSRRVWIENNDIKYTGLGPRWSLLTAIDTFAFISDDVSIGFDHGIDSIIVRKNRIDSVSQVGIGGSLYHWTNPQWADNYPGTVPYIVENNYITNFCMDFSDCGGIKVGFLNKNGIVRRNILVKGNSRDKRHLSGAFWYLHRHEGATGAGLYTDVHQEGVSFIENTVIGADESITHYGGDWNVRNIHTEGNTIYDPISGISLRMERNGEAFNCTANNNLLFGSKAGFSMVDIFDEDAFYAGVTYTDSLQELNNNRYFNPNGLVLHTRTLPGSRREFYGFASILQRTAYEQGPASYWGWWARYKWHWWDNAVVRRSLCSDPQLNASNITDLPFSPFGQAQVQIVPNSPMGDRAVLVHYPASAPEAWSGILFKTSEPLHDDTLSPGRPYRIQMIYAANKTTDFHMGVEFWSWHPATRDSFWSAYHYALPARAPYTWDSIAWRHEPLNFQRRTRPRITLRRGDSLWIRYFAWDEIDPASVPPLSWYYPIYYNPSDQPETFQLPNGQVYLTTDSVLVHTAITVPPWQSRILIWVGTSPAGALEDFSGTVSPTAVIYPNPTQDYLKVLVGEPGWYELYTLTGQLKGKGFLRGDGVENVLSLQELPEGVYLLRIRHRSGLERGYKVIRLKA